MKKIYNFSPGPSMLPKVVLKKAQKDLRNWKNSGHSVMEISHRSQKFFKMTQDIEKNLRDILNIPDNYKILFCQGGARGQFSAIPMNLLKNNSDTADYIISGFWSRSAFLEAQKYCLPKFINIIKNKKHFSLKNIKNWKISKNSEYIHYCPNETIEGIAIHEDPILDKKPIIGDFSSTILSQKININKYGLIYASAQKNIGLSGITLIIIKDNLLFNNKKMNICPSILDYQILYKNQSMFNTPTTFSWYMLGLVLQWIKKKGGIQKISKKNQEKASIIYNLIDKSNLYKNKIKKKNRSLMNICFFLKEKKLEEKFLKKATQNGLLFLKGHSLIGGLRASIYNAMPISGVKLLAKFMINFEKKNG